MFKDLSEESSINKISQCGCLNICVSLRMPTTLQGSPRAQEELPNTSGSMFVETFFPFSLLILLVYLFKREKEPKIWLVGR